MTVGFTLKQLEYFCAVAENGSFSAAGARLHVSPSAVASSVSDLERVLATQLLVRRKAHGVALTAAGSHTLKRARNLLAEAREVELVRGEDGSRLAGPVSIGCYSTLAASVLPGLLEEFSALHPDVDLSFVDGGMDDLVPMLRRSALDLIIAYRINLPVGVQEAVLYECDLHALLPGEHRLAGEPAIDVRELADEDLILLDLPPSGRHTLDLLGAAGITPTIRHRTQNFELVRSLVARGLGYSLLIQKPRITHSYEGLSLVTRPLQPRLSREAVVCIWPAATRLTNRARALVDYAREISAPALTKTSSTPQTDKL